MRRLILATLLLAVSFPVFADRYLDGFYITGGGFFSSSKVDFFGSERKISDTLPTVFVGYGRTSRPLGEKRLRMYVGIEGFYMGSGKNKSGSETVVDRQTTGIETEEIIEENSDGTTKLITRTTRETVDEDDIETRHYNLKQNSTYGAGLRVGITEQYENRGGALYAMLGYAKTELEGEGHIDDPDENKILTVPKQTLDFSGYYYGVGYEYAWNSRWALRADYLVLIYSDENFRIEDNENRQQNTPLRAPGRADLEQDGVFLGLTIRF